MPIQISREEIRAIYRQGEDAVVTLIESLIQRFNKLEEEVALLKAQVNKNSHNSSKPPSSDMFRPAPKSLREPSNRPSGGQPGHRGHHLQRVSNPDQVAKHHLSGRCTCGRALSQGRLKEPDCHQVFDLPLIQLKVTEHQAETRECVCGLCHTAEFPAEAAAPVQYGERISALTVYLSQYQLLPQKRIAEMMADWFGAPLSQGTINNILGRAHARLAPTEEAIQAAIKASPVMHNDETGMRIGGQLRWEHSSSTPKHTYYFCHARRGAVALRESGLLEGYEGRSVHDGWRSYFDFDILHALCNAHHLRELVFVKEELGQRWAGKMISLLRQIKRTVERARKANRSSLAAVTRERYLRRYHRILGAGYRANPLGNEIRAPGTRGRLKQPPARNLLDRLRDHSAETLAFMYDFQVPFDNNLSERDLRMTKVKQKVSGGFRSTAGGSGFLPHSWLRLDRAKTGLECDGTSG